MKSRPLQKKKPVAPFTKFSTPLSVSNWIINTYFSGVYRDPFDDVVDYYEKGRFKKDLKKMFPDGVVRAYRGVVYEPHEMHADMQNLDDFLMSNIFHDRGEVFCSLNACKSLWGFTNIHVPSYAAPRHRDDVGVFIEYRAPLSVFESWGQDGESGANNEFEIYATNKIKEYINKVFIITYKRKNLARASKSEIDYYSMDKVYLLFDDLYLNPVLHKNSKIEKVEKINYDYIDNLVPFEIKKDKGINIYRIY